MDIVSAARHETTLTYWTIVSNFFVVYPDVYGEVPRRSERLRTEVTAVGFLAVVDALVHTKIRFNWETFSTVLAQKRFVTHMPLYMYRELSALNEILEANTTAV